MPLHALNVNMIMFAMSYMMYNYDMRANWLKFWQRSNPVTKISHFRDSIHTHTHPHMHTHAYTSEFELRVFVKAEHSSNYVSL